MNVNYFCRYHLFYNILKLIKNKLSNSNIIIIVSLKIISKTIGIIIND